jgi:hypothetical protein
VETRATQLQSGARKRTYGRTQNLGVLRYFACHCHSQNHRRNLANDNEGGGVQSRPWILGTLRSQVRKIWQIRLDQRIYGACLHLQMGDSDASILRPV